MRIRVFRGAALLALPLLMIAAPLSVRPVIRALSPFAMQAVSASAADRSPQTRSAWNRRQPCVVTGGETLQARLPASGTALLEAETRARITLPLLLQRANRPVRLAAALSPPPGADQIAEGRAPVGHTLPHRTGLVGRRDRAGAPRPEDRAPGREPLPSMSLLAQGDRSETHPGREASNVGSQTTQTPDRLMCPRTSPDWTAGLAVGRERGRATQRAIGAGLETRAAGKVDVTERERISGIPPRAV